MIPIRKLFNNNLHPFLSIFPNSESSLPFYREPFSLRQDPHGKNNQHKHLFVRTCFDKVLRHHISIQNREVLKSTLSSQECKARENQFARLKSTLHLLLQFSSSALTIDPAWKLYTLIHTSSSSTHKHTHTNQTTISRKQENLNLPTPNHPLLLLTAPMTITLNQWTIHIRPGAGIDAPHTHRRATSSNPSTRSSPV